MRSARSISIRTGSPSCSGFPGYLYERDDLDLKTFGLPLAAIYLISDLDSVARGWMSSRTIKAGRAPNFAREATLAFWAACVFPIFFGQDIGNVGWRCV